MNLRYYSMVILICMTTITCKQEVTKHTEEATLPAKNTENKVVINPNMTTKELETIGYKNYNNNHQVAIDAFRQAVSIHESNEDHKSAAVLYTNISNLYRDGLKNKNAAVDYGLKALSHWKKEKDFLQQANLLKDLGLLQAETFQFRQAYRSLNEALIIFGRQNNYDGIAITEHNIATTNYIAERYDAAEQHLLLAKEHWVKKNNPQKVFNNNILAIKIYKDSDQLDKLDAIIEESENIRTHNTINRYADQRYLEAINDEQ